MSSFESRAGSRLYELMPAVYREQDQPNGDLARYLDALGLLLDRLRATLDQRLRDAFPDNPMDGGACQDWIVPYFARLLDVQLASPGIQGRRDEVAHAMRWRQAKGTLVAAQEIVESVTREETVLQEGWRRVALTPRVGLRPLPPITFGAEPRRYEPLDRPTQRARHPGLPAVTPDLRLLSRALRSTRQNLAVTRSRLGGVEVNWLQSEPLGVPRWPGHYDDVSRRTPDLRAADGERGQCHPRRLLAYTTVPWGLFPAPELRLADVDALIRAPQVQLSVQASVAGQVAAWELRVRNVSTRALVLAGDLLIDALPISYRPPLDAARAITVRIEGLRVEGRLRLQRGLLVLDHVLATQVQVLGTSTPADRPVLEAANCLFGAVEVPDGRAHFVQCTTRYDVRCASIMARNSLFAGAQLRGAGSLAQPAAGEIDHCRVPPGLVARAELIVTACTSDAPAFVASAADQAGAPIMADAGVLGPACPPSVAGGADDGLELGCFHDGRAGNPVCVSAPQNFLLKGTGAARLQDLAFLDAVVVDPASTQCLVLQQVAVQRLDVNSPALAGPALDARGCLFGGLVLPAGLARLEYCTVLGDADLASVQCSEALFAGKLQRRAQAFVPGAGDGLRYSRLPPEVMASPRRLPGPGCTDAAPVFFSRRIDALVAGCGVLHPAGPAALSAGAEDGGEIGAYHEQRHRLTRDAVLDKLIEHLPVGIQPVLVPDTRMQAVPPLEPPPVAAGEQPP